MPAPVTGTGASSSGSITAGYGTAQEQKDMFLQLLVAQLKNQDPSSPMDQKDMMGQMAQFTSVEQLTNMVSAMEHLSFNTTFSQSVGLIGKSVDYAVYAPDGTTSITTLPPAIRGTTTARPATWSTRVDSTSSSHRRCR